MTTATENELLTRVGPGTPMGELMRQYWIPAGLSSELKRDGDPLRLMLLGEKLVAFRDSDGRVGVFDHRCPHRRASLFFGRNEQGGIRCVYHGWKFDADGRCTDMMNVPNAAQVQHKVRARAYRTAERNGMFWVYMGEAAEPPALPDFECGRVPDGELDVRFTLRECNWLQVLEGELDTSHVGIMHFGGVSPERLKLDPMQQYLVANKTPEYVIEQTDYGHVYAAHRPAEGDRLYWRIGHYMLPFWTMPPINHLTTNVLTRACIPLDDTHTLTLALFKKGAYPKSRMKAQEGIAGASQNFPYLPDSTDWLGRFRLRANSTNDYEIDRELQRTGSFTGIDGIQLQDQAIQESMGGIVDRENEYLAVSDIMITRVRRQLMEAATAFRDSKALPHSATHPEAYWGLRGGQYVAPREANWLEAYKTQLKAAPWEAVGEKEAA